MTIIRLHILMLFTLLSCQKNVKNQASDNRSEIDQTEVTTEKQIEEIISPEIKMLEYLTSRFHKLPDSTFIKKPDWMIDENTSDIYCGYIIQFEEGHTFRHEQECVEWGEIVTVKFKGYSLDQVGALVEELFKNDNYSWYENKTEYRPEEYYETVWTFKIKEHEQSTELRFAYSWI
ncbi:hypothetical protein [Winogradskyella alexanderae]|uniref:Integron-associated effector binding protein domain-containing protein n=1 Tax=Winogradskyella alexanderae TaxID=2877123 RepID=A0ABS7XV86_9FLAO|nr:hypothetical protein [Winogradskyella alexanderae]MCA0133930.1 hypothetical protein [Winogradskyella alexanderae]